MSRPASRRFIYRKQAAAAALAHGADAAAGDDHRLVGVAMDSKTVSNTIAPGDPEGSEVKLFSAMLHREAVVIAQLRVPEGTNEITQVVALLKDVDLTGVVATGYAAHAQHTTAAYLTRDRGGHYVLAMQGNQCVTRRFDTSPSQAGQLEWRD